MTAPAAAAVPESPQADPAVVEATELRTERRNRILAAMEKHDLDVLVLGRPAEVAFASGARQLWTAGSRPFGPAAVAVRSTGRIHLLSVSDFDIPPEVSHEDLYQLWWNPANLVRDLARIPGMESARRVGTTSTSPDFANLLSQFAPECEEVDGSAALWEARTPKSDLEVERIRSAIALAEGALDAMEGALTEGATERDLRAVWLSQLAASGAPTPPTEAVVCGTATEGPVQLHSVESAEPFTNGQLVVLDPGAFFRGYEGGIGRTSVVGGEPSGVQRDLAARVHEATASVVAACVTGASGGDLIEAWQNTGLPVPPTPLVTGVGLGMEPPLIGMGLGTQSRLVDTSVVAVSGWAGEVGVGGVLRRDLVQVGAQPRLLTPEHPTNLESK